MEQQPSDPGNPSGESPRRRARYSTSWISEGGIPPSHQLVDYGGRPDSSGPRDSGLSNSGLSNSGLSINQWTILLSGAVVLFIVVALATGLIVGQALRRRSIPVQASQIVSPGSVWTVASQSSGAPADAQVQLPPQAQRESSVSLLFDTGPGAGDAAPNFQLQELGGDVLSLSELEGQVVVLNFWATWCTWCKYELPALQAVYEKYQDDGVTVLGVDVEEPQPLVDAYVQRYGLSFPVVLDIEGTASEAYKVRGLPMTFFIDRAGDIVRVQRGAMREDELESYVRELLAQD